MKENFKNLIMILSQEEEKRELRRRKIFVGKMVGQKEGPLPW